MKREVPGVDRIGRVDREKVLAALDPTPPATSAPQRGLGRPAGNGVRRFVACDSHRMIASQLFFRYRLRKR